MVGQRMAAFVGGIAYLQNLLERELLGSQGLSIPTSASLHYF
jgi:hypothetical protein